MNGNSYFPKIDNVHLQVEVPNNQTVNLFFNYFNKETPFYLKDKGIVEIEKGWQDNMNVSNPLRQIG